MNDISRPTPDSAIPLAVAPVRDVAAAVMVAPDGRYLMQLRDDFPGLHLADHWALFGGSIEPGETAETALRRELAEELTWRPREIYPLCVTVHAIWPEAPVHRLHFFVVPFTMDDHEGMVQCEGAGMALMTLGELAAREKVAPWDFCAVQFHARHRTLFPERATPDWLAAR